MSSAAKIRIQSQSTVEFHYKPSGVAIKETINGYLLCLPFAMKWAEHVKHAVLGSEGDFVKLKILGADIYSGSIPRETAISMSLCSANHAEKYITTVPMCIVADYTHDTINKHIECGNAMTLCVPVSTSMFAELENGRNGGDFIVSAIFYGTVRLKTTHGAMLGMVGLKTTHSEPLEFSIPQSDWVDVLKKAKISYIPRIEANLSNKKVINYFEAAEKQYQLGHYTDCVAKCRHIYDMEGFGPKNCPQKDAKKKDIDKSMDERFDTLFCAAKNITNPPNHAHGNGSDYVFNRAEALSMLMVTAAIAALTETYCLKDAT